MSIGYGSQKKYESVADITGPTGWYMVRVGGKYWPLYINQDYDGGGWVLVLANRRYTAGMNNLKWNDAMYSINYRHAGTDDATNSLGFGKSSPLLSDFNAWVGLSYWGVLSGRATANKITIVQYTADINGVELNGTHNQRIRCQADFIKTNGGFSGGTTLSLELNSKAWGNSGFSSYINGGYPLTTFDKDQDTNGGNCSTYYNNNPWWYTSCWSGNIFAGGDYIDGPYWVSSSSGYSQQYCGVYIK